MDKIYDESLPLEFGKINKAKKQINVEKTNQFIHSSFYQSKKIIPDEFYKLISKIF
jgi:hypothetical protein